MGIFFSWMLTTSGFCFRPGVQSPVLLSGPSGVGKTTFLRRAVPGSDKSGQAKGCLGRVREKAWAQPSPRFCFGFCRKPSQEKYLQTKLQTHNKNIRGFAIKRLGSGFLKLPDKEGDFEDGWLDGACQAQEPAVSLSLSLASGE